MTAGGSGMKYASWGLGAVGLRGVCLGVLAGLLLAGPLQAAESARRPVVGLVLSGGGAKGLAHVGVLRVLEEMHIPVDVVVGTSAGSAVGALYAMGMPVTEIEDRFIEMNWLSGFRDESGRVDQPVRRKTTEWHFPKDPGLGFSDGQLKLGRGIVQGQNLVLILNDMTRDAALVRDFDQLPLRYRAVATDLETGETVAIHSGSLADAIRISMSIPAVYTPVEHNGRLLVDGGIANNLPVDVARQLGADVIIAVDISDELLKSRELSDTLSVMGQLTTFLTRRNMNEQLSTLKDGDVLIQPKLDGLTSSDFDEVVTLFEMGATATRDAALHLQALRVSDADWEAYQAHRHLQGLEAERIDHVSVINKSRFSDKFLRARISQKPGQSLDRKKLEEDLRRFYGLGYFETVTYSLEPGEQDTQLIIIAKEKSWGPDYLRFGLGFEDNFDNDTRFNLAAQLQMTGLNPLGGKLTNAVHLGTEPKLRSELFQPLTFGHSRFLLAGIEWSRQPLDLYENSQRIAEYEVSQRMLDLAFGVELNTDAEILLGLRRGRESLERQVGVDVIPVRHLEQGGLTASLVYDTLNDPFLPDEGWYSSVSALLERPELGSDQTFDRLKAAFGGAVSTERSVLMGRFYVSAVTQGTPSVPERESLGGFKRLSAFSRNEIAGQDALLFSLFGYRRFGSNVAPLFAGAAYETGNAWSNLLEAKPKDLLHSFSLFGGVETFMGPIELATSFSDQDHWAVYLNVGYLVGNLFE